MVSEAMARCAESGENDSKCPYLDEIVLCFVHVCISRTVRFPLDKDAMSFLSGDMEMASSSPKLSCCSMQEADPRSKTRIDPGNDPTTSRFGQVNPSDNTLPDVLSFVTDLSVAPADQTWIFPPQSPDAICRPPAENAIHLTQSE